LGDHESCALCGLIRDPRLPKSGANPSPVM
jgi:hypothetical protein